MNNFNRYWPLLALPAAVVIAAVPYLPGPVRDARIQAQTTTPQTTELRRSRSTTSRHTPSR